MKLLSFQDDQEYLEAQYNTRRRRDKVRKKRELQGFKAKGFYLPEHFDKIADYVRLNGPDPSAIRPYRIMCHGARCGGEVREFKRAFPVGIRVYGTDLLPQRKSGLIRWDFRKEKSRWLKKFNIIYSNSLDHSNYPKSTLLVWQRQLAPGGKMFVEWTRWHGLRPKNGDCFAADFYEYIDLFESIGTVHDILYARPCRLLIVASR